MGLRYNKDNIQANNKIDLLATRRAPWLNLSQVQTMIAKGPFIETDNVGRWTLNKRQYVDGYVPNDPWTTAGSKTHLFFEKRKRYKKLRSLSMQVTKGARIEKLLANRKSNSVYAKSPLWTISNERFSRRWKHGNKVR
jgi:hypothetical protein